MFSSHIWAQSIPATLAWKGDTNGVIFSSPVIDESGVVYIGSNDNNLTAFQSDGSIKWTFATGNWVDSSPTLSKDGNTVYVGSWDNSLYAVNSLDGTLAWSFETNSYITSSPAVDLDGRIYFGSMDSLFYAIESNGSLAWEYFVGQPVFSSPAIGEDGTIYFGDENGTFHAINQDGSEKWTYLVDDVTDTNKSILSSPAIDSSGNIYFGSGNGYCYSLSDEGNESSLNWKYLTGDRVDSSPVLGINEEVFFVSRDGYIRSLPIFSATTENLPNWEEFTGDVFYSTPVVDENGRVYVIGYTGGGENHLFAFDANGTKAWDSNVSTPPFEIASVVDSSLLLSDDGKLYFGCFDKKLYCLDIGIGPADSHWPMFGRTSRRDRDWPTHTLSLDISGNTGGSVSGAGTYYQGSSATITATSETGYSFAGWSGEGVLDSNASTSSVEMTQARNVSATFTLNSYDLTLLAGNGGSVSGDGSYSHGSNATISATSETGYSFAGWSGEGVLDPSASTSSVEMTQARNVSATFTLNSYDLTLLAGNGGSVSGGGPYSHGSNPTISATPETGYSFAGWFGEGVLDSNASTSSVEMTQARNVSATFTLNSYDLTLLAGNGGSVSGGGSYSHGSNPTISATPETGYSFAGWTGEGVLDPIASTSSVEMNQTRNVSAIFTLNSYDLNLLAGNGGLVSGGGSYSHGSNPTISATPETGYSFAGWSGEGVLDSNASTSSVEMTQTRNVSAIFTLNSYDLTLLAGNGGSVSGDGSFSYNSLVHISALPNDGYTFDQWSGAEVTDPNSPHTTILLTESQTITAEFTLSEAAIFSLVLEANPTGSGILTGGGNYLNDQNVSISAQPLNGYTFTRWIGYPIDNFEEPDASIIVDSNLTLTAQFSPISYSITAESTGGGSVTGSGTYDFGTEANLTALANDGYIFDYWIGDGIENPLLSSVTLTVGQDLSIQARFSPISYHLALNETSGGNAFFSGSNPFTYDSNVSIYASANPGYNFVGWSGEGVVNSGADSTEVHMTQDRNLTANFESYHRSLIVLQNLASAGSVTGGGFYKAYQYVNILASANPGYQFSHWLGSGIEEPLDRQTRIFLTNDSLATASFTLSLLSQFLNADDLGNGWFSTWMGVIFQSSATWIYHRQLGWMYPQLSEEGVWLWKENTGWLWTDSTPFSNHFLWSHQSENWIYLNIEDTDPLKYFDYRAGAWTEWPD